MELSKTYNPSEVENKWYQYWLEHKYFHADAHSNKPKYSIVIPPPNVTGVLHMGHMLNNTIQDVLVRRARMKGFEACWIPGTDHASIATEAKVVAMLREKGIKKSDIGREAFLKHAFEWKEKYGGIILEQLKKLGASCDWDRTRFTMEDSLSEAVIDVFIDLYNKGLIYRGERMINWDPQGKTAISDEEIIETPVQAKLYYIKYAIESEKDSYITIATSRPETIMADAAICVHPEDERYKHLIGKKALIPLINRAISIIADEYVSLDFGTGALKVTPAHDRNDYDLGIKHQLEFIDILNDDATLNEKAQILVGLDRFEARKKIGKLLEESGSLEKIEDYNTHFNTSERTGAVIEPKMSLQWFVDMKKFISNKPKIIDAVMNDEINFHPAKFKNTYKYWMENIKDWCISRQLWWGQQIPAWYNENGQFVVCKTEAEAIQKFKDNSWSIKGIRQDEDVVDTWFSSWLWPISVFDGFKDPNNPDIKAFYPTHTLVTAPEIIFFWVARMIMAGYEYQGQKPFSHVYFTGIVRDKQRRKMSKSLGNSPDPLDLIDKHGADAVRMGMLLCSPAGNDILFDESLIEQGRNFANKIWNAFRLISGWEIKEDADISPDRIKACEIANDWFNAQFNQKYNEIEQYFEEYRLSDALMAIYKLIWDDYCAWYLEMIKPEYGQPIHKSALEMAKNNFSKILRLLNPFMPFITEELHAELFPGQDPLIISEMPRQDLSAQAPNNKPLELITEIRNIRNAKGISPKETLDLALLCENELNKIAYQNFEPIIKRLANIGSLSYVEQRPEQSLSFLIGTDTGFLNIGNFIDPEIEKEKINKEIEYLQGFLKSVDAKLSNEKFVANAKPELVEKERQKKADAELKIKSLNESLNAF